MSLLQLTLTSIYLQQFKMKKKKHIIGIWWFIQLCVLIYGTRHLGHVLVDILLLTSLLGYLLGGRKTTIVSSFGLAFYSTLTLLGALFICYLMYNLPNENWWIAPIILVISILNMGISFRIIILLRRE